MSTRIHRLQQLRARLENGEALELSPDYRIDFARADVEYLLKLAEAGAEELQGAASAFIEAVDYWKSDAAKWPCCFPVEKIEALRSALTKHHQTRGEKA